MIKIIMNAADIAIAETRGVGNKKPEPVNELIAEAMSRGEDTTGLCTVRDLASYIIEEEKRRMDGNLECELIFKTITGEHVTCTVSVIKDLKGGEHDGN